MVNQTTDLIGLVFQVSRLMRQKMNLSTDLQQLSVLQTQTLMYLNCNKQASTMSDIASYLHIELPSATSLVNKLVKQDLVKRTSDSSDRRIVKITITKIGEKLLHEALEMRKKKLSSLLSYLSPKQKEELSTILKTVLSHLEA